MCGFVAAIGEVNESQVSQMMERIKHRGPDGNGITRIGNVILGHVRLSILDIAGGSQPMTSERGDLSIAFNGEIYNYLDLRRILVNRHIFNTHSDTEVLIHLYEDIREDMFDQLDGMFSVALAGQNDILLARDSLGIKPLYYGRKGSAFLAASELKAFPPMDELHMLEAGNAMFASGKKWRFSKSFPPFHSLIKPPLSEVLQEIRRRLELSVLKRLMGDVPVGVYLSGGLDSSLVAALMRPHSVQLHSFTAGMRDAPDLKAARRIAKFLGTEHHELIYNEEDIKEALPEVIWHLESFDAPLVRSALPMYFVSRLAAKYVKVVLSGEGADELFAGYSYLSRLSSGTDLRKELADITVRLQDTNLQRADRMSMAHGLEARVPFLDMDLVRYISHLPIELIEPRADRQEKWLLRQACRGILPSEILDRKKMKFSEGAGSENVVAKLVETSIDSKSFEYEKTVMPGLILRSPEELFYYRIWREVMGPDISPFLIGRTIDRSAASDVRVA